ncbi:bifunctional adenosylcobinamide kinase/adenosylcobinamide-phosphate guanylyltransferase [Natronospora cellulosivora (SeqCode)]
MPSSSFRLEKEIGFANLFNNDNFLMPEINFLDYNAFKIYKKGVARMKNITFIVGGARSGKSSFAEKIAKESSSKVVYIATAIPFDKGMKDRIKKHQAARPAGWETIEQYNGFKNMAENHLFLQAELILLDCITLMVSNLLLDSGLDFDKSSIDEIDQLEDRIFQEIKDLLEVIEDHEKEIILVSNEVGMGLVAEYSLGNVFRDIAGRVNQYLAKEAGEVYFMVAGIPMKIKGD